MSNRLGGFIAGQNINASIGTFTAVTSPTFTFGSTQGTPAVGQAVQFTTTGTLPTGLSINTTYYVISTSTNTCQFSTTQSGSAVTFTNSSGSGTHTAVTQRAFNPYAGAPDTVEYLVVAGGGGGGGAGGGGGGAGGVKQAASFSVATGSALTVTIGGGGAGGSGSSPYTASNGQNSVFSSITATAGGAGGGAGNNGSAGGSGGGGAGSSVSIRTGGAGTSGEGNAGGSNGSQFSSPFPAGAGGGAGSVGGTAVSGGTKPNGGTGICSTISGARVFYGGGGGAGNGSGNAPGGLGGGGGGGNGYQGSNGAGDAGTANTGGGGGGGVDAGGGGNGGSGIVIVRYPQLISAPAMVTGSPQVSYSDGYQIYTWTSSGSIIF